MNIRRIVLCLVSIATLVPASPADAAKFEGLSLERLARLGEADRYQLTIAQDYFEKSNWLVAASEYEKFLSLYESSEGAPYAQLQWSLCQANLRKQNTAIKDGYQSVIDYWPESPEAVTAAYLIGRTYKSMGDNALAKKAYLKVIATHPAETVAVRSKIDLADLARIEGDTKRKVALWNEVVFATERTKDNKQICTDTSKALATQNFSEGDFDGGLKSLATSYSETQLPGQISEQIRPAISSLVSTKENEPTGLKLADKAVAFLRSQAPAAPTDDAQKNQFRAAMYDVADIERSAKRLTEADKAYDEILKVCGPSDAVLGRKAQFYKDTGRRDLARTTYGKFENQIAGQSAIAYSYREEGKSQLAIPIYEDLVARDAANASKWQWELAIVYRDAGKYKEAIAAFRQTGSADSTLQIAYCYRGLKDFKEAIALLQQVIVSSTGDSGSGVMLELARTYEQAGQAETAIKTFQQVCKRYPKTQSASLAHVHLNEKYKINITLGGATTE